MPKDVRMKRAAYVFGAVVCWIISVIYIFSAYDLTTSKSGVWALAHITLAVLFLAGGTKLFKRYKTLDKGASNLSGEEIAPEVIANERMDILLEYSDEASAAFKGISGLPDDFQRKFLETIEEGEVSDYRKLAQDIRGEYETLRMKERNPYDDKELNRGYSKALKIGPDAGDEFKRVIEVLGDKSDVPAILSKLTEKFRGRVSYKGCTIRQDDDGKLRVFDSNGHQLKGSLEYETLETAKEAVDFLG
jgi:hypothetical protein